MSFWTGPGQLHLEGHRNETCYTDAVHVKPKKEVYIPLDNGSGYTFEAAVKEGDLVSVGTYLGKWTGKFDVPQYASVSGKVGATKNLMHAVLKPIAHLTIEDDGKYTQVQSFKPLDYKSASNEALLDLMKQSGLVGMGGAGFPTYVKYLNPQGIDTLLINAVECEPYITSDNRMTSDFLDLVYDGSLALLKLSKAQKLVIAVKGYKKVLVAQLKEAFKSHANVEIFSTKDVYPMGWERTLVYAYAKKRYNRLPSEVGFIVNNVTTAISFAKALKTGMGVTEKLVTFSGDGLVKSANVWVPVGTQVKDVVEALGGYSTESVLLIAGGPMMGKTITNDDLVVHTYSNAFTILNYKPVDAMECIRCGRCNDACPAGLLPVRINNAEKMKDLDMIEKLQADACIECGLCTYVCPSRIDVTEGVRRAKRALTLRKR